MRSSQPCTSGVSSVSLSRGSRAARFTASRVAASSKVISVSNPSLFKKALLWVKTYKVGTAYSAMTLVDLVVAGPRSKSAMPY